VGDPDVLFLDEPTTGLDPRSRRRLWEFIEGLVGRGTTLLLTTQYLEEADRLADRIGVIDGGRLIDEGTSDELKQRIGGDVIEFLVDDPADLDRGAALLDGLGSDDHAVDREAATIRLPVANAAATVTEAVRRLDAGGVAVADLAIHRPTLDDVFLTLTGHHAEEEPAGNGAPGRRGRKRSRK
jgi:ABC-2 type transport system ATP-binding protein